MAINLGDLVRFDRVSVGELLEPGVDNWESWIGVITHIESDIFCKVLWDDGIIRQEYFENLEVLSNAQG